MEYQIEICTAQHQKEIRRILESLHEYFGIPSAIDNYVADCLHKPIFIAYENKQFVGFLSLKKTSSKTAEVYVMAIYENYHHKGIGTVLLQNVKEYCRQQQTQYLQVKTLSPEVKDASYLKTYAFYQANGFIDVEVLPLWDEWNPCLLMIQKI